eukprot:930381-Prymnesium_polylepis.1
MSAQKPMCSAQMLGGLNPYSSIKRSRTSRVAVVLSLEMPDQNWSQKWSRSGGKPRMSSSSKKLVVSVGCLMPADQ